MKGIIEQEIEKYANKNEEYPKTIEISEREYEILSKEIQKEYESIGQSCGKLEKFRGCKLKINKKIKKFRIIE